MSSNEGKKIKNAKETEQKEPAWSVDSEAALGKTAGLSRYVPLRLLKAQGAPRTWTILEPPSKECYLAVKRSYVTVLELMQK